MAVDALIVIDIRAFQREGLHIRRIRLRHAGVMQRVNVVLRFSLLYNYSDRPNPGVTATAGGTKVPMGTGESEWHTLHRPMCICGRMS